MRWDFSSLPLFRFNFQHIINFLNEIVPWPCIPLWFLQPQPQPNETRITVASWHCEHLVRKSPSHFIYFFHRLFLFHWLSAVINTTIDIFGPTTYQLQQQATMMDLVEKKSGLFLPAFSASSVFNFFSWIVIWASMLLCICKIMAMSPQMSCHQQHFKATTWLLGKRQILACFVYFFSMPIFLSWMSWLFFWCLRPQPLSWCFPL